MTGSDVIQNGGHMWPRNPVFTLLTVFMGSSVFLQGWYVAHHFLHVFKHVSQAWLMYVSPQAYDRHYPYMSRGRLTTGMLHAAVKQV